MESRTTRFESGHSQTLDYTNELIANSNWLFDVGQPLVSGTHRSVSVTATNKLDGAVHKIIYSVKPNLTKRCVDIYTSYTSQKNGVQNLTCLKDEFTVKMSVRYADVLPWVAATREKQSANIAREHGTGVPAKIALSYALPLIYESFGDTRAELHDRKSLAKDKKDLETNLFDE
jgi:hypothetical protein